MIYLSLKRTRKFEMPDHRLRKAELDLELLLWCRDRKAISVSLDFHVSSQSLKASLTYKQYQGNLLNSL